MGKNPANKEKPLRGIVKNKKICLKQESDIPHVSRIGLRRRKSRVTWSDLGDANLRIPEDQPINHFNNSLEKENINDVVTLLLLLNNRNPTTPNLNKHISFPKSIKLFNIIYFYSGVSDKNKDESLLSTKYFIKSHEYNFYMNCFVNNIGLSRKFLEEGIDPNCSDIVGNSVLLNACGENHIDMCKLLISFGANINNVNTCGITVLHIASYFGYTELLQFLLPLFSNKNIQDIYGNTPLHYAIKKNNINAVSLLIHNNANIYSMNKLHVSPMYIACIKEIDDIIFLFLDNGFDVNSIINTITKYRMLHVLCKYKKNDIIIKLLQRNDININIQSNNGDTPLHICYITQNSDIIPFLEQKNPDIYIKNNNGLSVSGFNQKEISNFSPMSISHLIFRNPSI